MALAKVPKEEITETFRIDPVLLETPAAKHAMLAGLLQAKRQAMRQAEGLLRIGRPLLVAVIFVSFLHVFETIAAIRPAFVEELQLPGWLYHLAAALLTLAIDLAALYVVSAHASAALVVGQTRRPAVWFFLVTTFLLNAAYVVQFAPSLPGAFQQTILPWLNTSFVFLLPAFVPVAIFSIEGAVSRLDVARLRLLVETTALADLVSAHNVSAHSISAQNASGSIMSRTEAEDVSRTVAGRLTEYSLDDLLDVVASEQFSRAEAGQALGCSDATLTRLIKEGMGNGLIVREGRGVYRVVRTK